MQKSFIGAKVIIAGSGISGQGAKFALESRGAKCFVFDDALYSTIPMVQFDYVVVSPSIPPTHIIFDYARVHKIPIIGEIELGYRFNEGQIIAITGTNGKTTTTELIGAMLSQSGIAAKVCGNIGVSFAEASVKGGYDSAVVEVSSFQLETIDSFKPHIAVITNISADHLDRHVSMENYANIKKRIAEYQSEDDYLILSQDDIPLFCLQDFSPKANVLYTSVRGKVRGAYLLNDNLYYLDELICSRDRLKLQGGHNVANALSAICAAKLSGADNDSIVKTLSSFEADAHRLKLVRSVGGKQFYNDSKGTNIGATVKACEAMCGSICLIAGGSFKGYEYDELILKMGGNVKRIVAIGQTAKKIYEAGFRNKFYDVTICRTLAEAVALSAKGTEDNVLLSPASASFDMFKNYRDRGEQFEKLVLESDEKFD